MTDDELDHELAERRQELFNLRFQAATGAVENTGAVEAREAGDRPHPHRPPRAGSGPGDR